MWLNGSQQILNTQPFRQNPTSPAASLALTTQQQALISRGLQDPQSHKDKATELKEKQQMRAGHRPLTRAVSCGFASQQNGNALRHSALNQHRALQRSASYDSRNNTAPNGNTSLTGSPPSSSKSSNGYRSRETGVVEKLLLSYGFIKCADREGRLFFHYSQFHGEAHQLHISDEVEFEVSMDNRSGKPVAVQVVKLKKGTVVFEVFSEERILGEVTNPAAPTGGTVTGIQPSEKGESLSQGNKYGSLSYERNGEFFFLPYTANDLTNKSVMLFPGDKVSFYIATEKRTGVLRARKITLVERAPPKRFVGIVTAMKESFGFIERADVVKEIFFHYSEVNPNVPDLHVGDHVEFSVQERNSKEVATEVRLLPPGSVLMEQVSEEIYVGTVEKPLPPKPSNKLQVQQTNAGGDATAPNINDSTISKVSNGSYSAIPSPQPVLALAGVINYTTQQGESLKIRFGEKDRASNCLYTLCKGDQVSFLTVTDKRNGQQRAAGVSLMLEETLAISGEKREMGIVAAVKEGFGFIKCLERDSRLFFHCCELLDPTHHIRMSDEVEFTVLQDPIAEKFRLHATRIRVLPKGTVVFHNVSDEYMSGTVVTLPGSTVTVSPAECLISPALGPNPGFITYTNPADESNEEKKIPFLAKDFAEWMEASTLKIGDMVTFRVCMVKRTGAQNAIDIRKTKLPLQPQRSNAADVIRNIISNLALIEEPSADKDVPSPPAKTPITSGVTPRTPIQSSPQKIIPRIEDTAIPAPLFKLDPVPKNSSRKDSTPSTPNKLTRSPSNNTISPSKAIKSPVTDVSKKAACHGWISTIKETFGFIELLDHTAEIFFHFSELQDPVEKFTIGCPVKFYKGEKDDKPCALLVSMIQAQDMPLEEVIQDMRYEGRVTRTLKSVNNELKSENNYQGKIEYEPNADEDETSEILFSPVSLNDRRDFLQVGDAVTFQIAVNSRTNTAHAMKLSANREMLQAAVESIRGDFGFLNYEVKGSENPGKLFFHMSEVREGAENLAAGVLVEFSVVYNQRSGKYSASNLKCLESKMQRPERLRLRSACETVSTISVIRQPKGPVENQKGFTLARVQQKV